MRRTKGEENRKYPRIETALPIHFNLNPDHHYVPNLKKLGVAGTVRNISFEGLGIDSRMDLLDVCQIFPEEVERGSTFQLEVSITNPMKGTRWMRGAVRWYRVSEPDRDIREFRAGLHLKDSESRAVANGLVESTGAMPTSGSSWQGG